MTESQMIDKGFRNKSNFNFGIARVIEDEMAVGRAKTEVDLWRAWEHPTLYLDN